METLVVPASLDSLEAIRKHVQKAAADAGLEKKDSYRLLLAVDEVATNIITHGYLEAGIEGRLEVKAEVDGEHLTIALGDSGPAFDPTQVSEPDVNQPVEERKVGGMGLYLAIRNVDHFKYQRVGDQNRNIFIMKRKQMHSGGNG
ncbi:MAG: ATP-binding protein [Spirochaetia bacterium]|jgi:anti-sigma regulatory factor (Ser/Thr protein kinase)